MTRLSRVLFGGVVTLAAAASGLALFSGLVARRVEAALPPQGRFIEIDGNRIHYLDRGSGPAIILVHGLGGTMHNFTYGVVERLTERFRVVVMERPGAGHSERARGASARLGVQADVVARFVRALGLERPLLVGHSLGGALSLAVALQHPEAIGGLALVSPLTQPQDTIPATFRGLAIRSPLLRRLVAWTLATPLTILNRDIGLAEVFGPEAAPSDYASRGGGALGLRPRSFYAASSDLMAIAEELPGFAARYAGLSLPVGILFGAGDRILDAELHGGGLAAQLPGARLEMIAGGHMIPVTQPQAVADFIASMAEIALQRTA